MLYTHTGIGSKTTRMAQLLPFGLEGVYSYRDILDASIWVPVHEFGLPAYFRDVIHDDMINSIAEGIRDDPQAAEHALHWIRTQTGRRLTSDSEHLEAALGAVLPIRDLPDDFLDRWDFRAPIYLTPFEEATRALQEVDPVLDLAP
jgi:hypothetical protein